MGVTAIACIAWGACVALILRVAINALHPGIVLSVFGFGAGGYVSIPNYGLFAEQTIPLEEQGRHHSVSNIPLLTFALLSIALGFLHYAFHSGASSVEESKPLSQQQINRVQITAMRRALDAAQQATFISNSRGPGAPLTQAQLDRMLGYDVQAIRSATSTDEENLNHIYPELGTRFKRQFVEGRRLFVSGTRNRSLEDLMKSKELDDSWADWYMANRKAIEDAANRAIR